MKKLVTYFIDRSFAVNLICLAICGAGIFMMMSLTRNLAPKVPMHKIRIEVSILGASPQTMEQEVAFPIEESLLGMPAVEEIYSYSSKGSVSFNLELYRGKQSLQETLEAVRSRLQSMQSQLPSNIERMEASLVKLETIDVMGYGFFNFDVSNPEHHRWLDSFKETMRQVKGVVRVDSREPQQDLYIEIDPAKLSYHGISISDLRRKLASFLQPTPLGAVRKDGRAIIVDIQRPPLTLETLENVTISSNRFGQEILIKDVAEIKFRPDHLSRVFPFNGKPGVFVQPAMDTSDDAITISTAIREAVAEFEKELPEPLYIEEAFNSGDFIQQQLDVLTSNALMGFVLVTILLAIFVGIRPAIMTAIGLPVAYLGTMICIDHFGVNIDLISVMAMIIIVGILVDDAIIVAEKYVQNIEAGLKPRDAAIDAALSLMAPITGTILTTMVAFSPILLVDGDISDWFYSVPIIIMSALALSWFECFFILPNHLKHFVTDTKAWGDGVIQYFARVYRNVLKVTLKLRWLMLFVGLGIFAGSGAFLKDRMKLDFDLNIGATRLQVVGTLKESQSIDDTLSQIKEVESFLVSLRDNANLDVVTRPGSAYIGGSRKTGMRYFEFSMFVFDLKEDQKTLVARVKDAIEKGLPELKDDRFDSLELVSRTASSEDIKQDTVTVYVSGKDRVGFDKIEAALKQDLDGIPGMLGAYFDDERLQESWFFVPDFKKMESYGLSNQELTNQLAGVFSPVQLGYTRFNGKQVKIYSEINRKEDFDYEDLQKLTVQTPQKTDIPVSYIGSWKRVKAQTFIAHRDGKRIFEVDVRYDKEQTDLLKFKEAVAAALNKTSEQFPDYTLSVESADKSQEEAQGWIIKVIGLSLTAILLILALTLGSISQSVLVVLPIPLGFLGAVWAFYLHQLDLTLIGMVGLLGVAGVAVNDSIIMVYSVNRLMEGVKERAAQRDKVIEGAVSRLRAIMLTTITTLGGVFPMAYGWGGESGYTKPIAFSMGWGLLASTIATLFVIPIVMEMRHDILAGFRWLGGLFQKQWKGESQQEHTQEVSASESPSRS
ncbi:efflux RND transporter permease subunit [Pseudobacteriovorax antillogorgiicola]|uniref:Multidrug efflux pump subunit AcrB n=1 Tax=Pseudobacteriovorax antillogorgiicola TaxID=1513793 RepID=A0A1Y6CNH1_9BACT|nr:efflux RND transporter permease subunit [Pseudobacteriovorax antillogorgiicola]TCS44793.1 multidrug efflux pump subunit AcrB [Pseudobacteriovorax antillogorgiicola]SMF77416.1 Multidrug efflux pump subunit AcrB [Pseudobacteriovorax antillogorgiicola]